MVSCRGLGILVLPVGFAPIFLTEFLVEWIAQDADYYQRELWPLLVACWSSAGALFGLRVGLERHAAHSPSERHCFLFAPVAWWPWIVAGLGIVMTAMRLLGLDP
jgi:hypothetical protein